MHVTIVEPRLDIPFKDTGQPVPAQIGPISPIRQHWSNFTQTLRETHAEINDTVIIERIPGWKITLPEMTDLSLATDLLYLPHRQRFDFPISNARFYMQTVFPEYFTIDDNGWGAFLSYLPMNVDGVEPNEKLWAKLQHRLTDNVSKFDQPDKNQQYELNLAVQRYILFVCQIPHDQVIIQSSTISVLSALRLTIEYARYNGYKLIVKGHPVNPAAMIDLKTLTHNNSDVATWVENVSVHTLLRYCKAAFMVNSGVGFEAMLHGKPIVTFGNSEYKEFVNQWAGVNTPLNMDYDRYKRFMTAFFNKLFYTGEPE